MFHVQPAPTAFHHHARPDSSLSYPTSSNATVQLPRTLSRPPFTDISREAILAVDPELVNVPPEYIRRGLRVKAQIMQAGIAALPQSHMPPTVPRSQLPSSLTIPVRISPHAPNAPTYPTHVLALSSSSRSSGTSDFVPLFPVHSIVLAAHCAKVPRLPPSSQSFTPLTLPVLPLSLPSPAAFPLLHTYLYTHSLQTLLSALLPLPLAFTQSLSTPHARAILAEALASGPKLHQLSTYLCAHAVGNLQTLTSHASHVSAFWKNCVALGVYEPELWDIMDLAWEVVLGALNLAHAAH